MTLMDLLPDYYCDNKTMKELQGILEDKITVMTEDLRTVLKECFISTAVSLLSRYEKIFEIKSDTSKSIEARRGKMLAKLTGTGTFTKSMLIDTMNAFPYCNAEIIEDSANSKFTVKFNNYYRIPDDSSIIEVSSIIDDLKPAHLVYSFSYTYDWWGHVNGTAAWGNMNTWEAARVY